MLILPVSGRQFIIISIMTNYYDEFLIEEQPLRRKVSDIYSKQVITTLPMDKVGDVAKKMSKAAVSSVVVKAFNDKPVGIITERDLVRKILSTDSPDLERKAHEIMSPEIITVRPDDFTYQALLMMVKHNISHIVVTDEHDVLHGIITIKDLIRNRNSGALSIVRQIEEKNSFSELAEMISEVDQVQQALLSERSYASEICSLITELYDRITRKIIQIAETQMVEDGLGKPPVDYCFISMGSAGRKEQFSRTDQDNGIIFEDSANVSSEMAASYFLTLGKKIVYGLEKCGFKRCKGEVMADNPRWCRPLSLWKDNVKMWVDKLNEKDIRNMTIFLDYRYITGDKALYDKLKAFTTTLFRNSKHALLFMAEDDLRHRVPINMFGQLITDKAENKGKLINLKSTVMVHLVDCIRLFTLREGIQATNSFERIQKLGESGVIKADDAEYMQTAYEALLMFRIKNGLARLKENKTPDYFIDINSLSRKEKGRLKKALNTVNRLQSLTAHAFHVHKA